MKINAELKLGFLYVAPYYEATLASFYEDLKEHQKFEEFEGFGA